jgi:hypothetical protein
MDLPIPFSRSQGVIKHHTEVQEALTLGRMWVRIKTAEVSC